VDRKGSAMDDMRQASTRQRIRHPATSTIQDMTRPEPLCIPLGMWPRPLPTSFSVNLSLCAIVKTLLNLRVDLSKLRFSEFSGFIVATISTATPATRCAAALVINNAWAPQWLVVSVMIKIDRTQTAFNNDLFVSRHGLVANPFTITANC